MCHHMPLEQQQPLMMSVRHQGGGRGCWCGPESTAWVPVRMDRRPIGTLCTR